MDYEGSFPARGRRCVDGIALCKRCPLAREDAHLHVGVKRHLFLKRGRVLGTGRAACLLALGVAGPHPLLVLIDWLQEWMRPVPGFGQVAAEELFIVFGLGMRLPPR